MISAGVSKGSTRAAPTHLPSTPGPPTLPHQVRFGMAELPEQRPCAACLAHSGRLHYVDECDRGRDPPFAWTLEPAAEAERLPNHFEAPVDADRPLAARPLAAQLGRQPAPRRIVARDVDATAARQPLSRLAGSAALLQLRR